MQRSTGKKNGWLIQVFKFFRDRFIDTGLCFPFEEITIRLMGVEEKPTFCCTKAAHGYCFFVLGISDKAVKQLLTYGEKNPSLGIVFIDKNENSGKKIIRMNARALLDDILPKIEIYLIENKEEAIRYRKYYKNKLEERIKQYKSEIKEIAHQRDNKGLYFSREDAIRLRLLKKQVASIKAELMIIENINSPEYKIKETFRDEIKSIKDSLKNMQSEENRSEIKSQLICLNAQSSLVDITIKELNDITRELTGNLEVNVYALENRLDKLKLLWMNNPCTNLEVIQMKKQIISTDELFKAKQRGINTPSLSSLTKGPHFFKKHGKHLLVGSVAAAAAALICYGIKHSR